MKQLLSHLVGDYLLQSHWMATEKRKSDKAAALHALAYTAAFLPQTRKIPALVGIASTHYLIDRYGLARYPIYAKNFLSPGGLSDAMQIVEHRDMLRRHKTKLVTTPTGMPEEAPQGLATGLFITADNTLHLLCNAFFLRR